MCHFRNKSICPFLRFSQEGTLGDDLLPVIHKTDLRLGAAYDNTHTYRARLLPYRSEQGVALSFNLPVSAACRQKETVPLAIGHRFAFAADHALTVQDQDTQERGLTHCPLHPVGEHSVQIQLVDSEVITVRHMRILASALQNRHTACHSQSLFDMEISFFTVLTDSAVIIDAVSDIGVLLDLGNKDSFADRMKRSGLDKENIALLDRHCIEHLEERILLDPPGKFLAGNLLLESVIEESSLLRVENIPHLCFAVLALVLQCKTVARMDLDRQVVLRVNELGQDRELAESPAVGPEHFHTLCVQIFLQRFPGIGTIHDHRRSVRMTGQFPCLSQDLSVKLHVVLFCQSVTAPQIILACRLQF